MLTSHALCIKPLFTGFVLEELYQTWRLSEADVSAVGQTTQLFLRYSGSFPWGILGISLEVFWVIARCHGCWTKYWTYVYRCWCIASAVLYMTDLASGCSSWAGAPQTLSSDTAQVCIPYVNHKIGIKPLPTYYDSTKANGFVQPMHYIISSHLHMPI